MRRGRGRPGRLEKYLQNSVDGGQSDLGKFLPAVDRPPSTGIALSLPDPQQLKSKLDKVQSCPFIKDVPVVWRRELSTCTEAAKRELQNGNGGDEDTRRLGRRILARDGKSFLKTDTVLADQTDMRLGV